MPYIGEKLRPQKRKMKMKCHKSCCCKCMYRHPVNCQPVNNIGKGPISKVFGYICFGLKDCEGGELIFMDRKHGAGCELFSDKRKVKKELCPLIQDLDTLNGSMVDILESLPGMVRAAAYECGKLNIRKMKEIH